MNKTLLLVATTASALSVGHVASAATPVPSHSGNARQAVVYAGRDPKAIVLYDQSANDSGYQIVSAAFEPAYSQYTSQVADDFTVPVGKKWAVSEVDVAGRYFNGPGPANSENVFFYKASKSGLPGKKIMEIDGIVGKDDGAGNFAITLPKAVRLKAGIYFMSVQANMVLTVGGQWGWDSTVAGGTPLGNPAAWQNPQNGFSLNCPTYMVELTCIPGQEGPDHIFTILGKSN